MTHDSGIICVTEGCEPRELTFAYSPIGQRLCIGDIVVVPESGALGFAVIDSMSMGTQCDDVVLMTRRIIKSTSWVTDPGAESVSRSINDVVALRPEVPRRPEVVNFP